MFDVCMYVRASMCACATIDVQFINIQYGKTIWKQVVMREGSEADLTENIVNN